MAEPLLRPADKEQAERLHTFAHDIKNRLGGLWETLRMLQSDAAEGTEKQDLIGFAERGYFNAQRDLERLLDDFGVDRGVPAERLPFDLLECLRTAVRNETYRLQKKEQVLDIKVPALAVATGDARWTAQVFQALISNASKFSGRGATIHVILTINNTEAEVRVADQGCGLSQADLQQVFTRYALLDSRSTANEPQSRGTLGRAKQWAEAQGGNLSAASDGVGKGCTFTLRLPV